MRIALAGNPNSGKTTLFNALTGSNQYVGNWPGVTVEKKEGRLKSDKSVVITDLPGIYSLSPYSLEEVVARNYLIDERPDAIINVVDGTNLERNLYLTSQLLELGIPMVVAINMSDLVEKAGDKINMKGLAKALGCPVVNISALNKVGITEACEVAVKQAVEKDLPAPEHKFDGAVEHAIAHIEEAALHNMPAEQQRWFAVKLFERDKRVREKLNLAPSVLDHIEKDIINCEQELDDDAAAIITNERYVVIAQVIGSCYKRASSGLKQTTSDKIDRIVTNRWLGLPIFGLVIWAVYYFTMSGAGGIGTFFTDWVNDVLFGEMILGGLGGWFEAHNVAPWLTGLVVDGIVNGVGAVLGFLPQIIVLYFCLALLEECGYMARVAFVLDRIFRKFGLSGKSFIPMLVTIGCGVPGVMATRTIEQEKDRRMTIMTTNMIPCSAKVPIIALIAGSLFGGASWVAPSTYFLGIGAIIVSGIILKKTKAFAGDPVPFIMELPAYHRPTISGVLHSVWERVSSFIKKAGTVIVLATVLVWFLVSFGWVDGQFRMLDVLEMDNSVLAHVGNLLAWIFVPLGFGNWRAVAATVTGLIAKENVVATFGIIYGGLAEVAEDGAEIWTVLQSHFTGLQGYAFLAFNLICAPCFAAIGAIKREMNSTKWTWRAIGYQCGFAWLVALIIYQIGMLFTGQFTAFTVLGIAGLALLLYLLFRPAKRAE